jgi:ABC-type dipeptide/oligopeptide/nickel transport system permease component
MWAYVLRRLLVTIPTVLAVVTICYLMLHATPGGPFDAELKVSDAVLANLQAKYHLCRRRLKIDPPCRLKSDPGMGPASCLPVVDNSTSFFVLS